jgi:DNA processing protein
VLELVRPLAGLASPRMRYDPAPAAPPADAGAAEREAVEQLLGPSPVPVDEIVRLSGLPAGAVQLLLLELDLAGRLDRHAGGKVSLRL